MKKFFIFTVCMFFSVCLSAKNITFSKWECSAMSESVTSYGKKEFRVHYQKVCYIISEEDYKKLEAGCDITLTIE